MPLKNEPSRSRGVRLPGTTARLSIGLWLLAAPLASAEMRLQARLVDDATGLPAAARVAVTSPEGRFLEIDGPHTHVRYLGKRWCHVEGAFSSTIPDPGAVVDIRRGFETRPLSDAVGGAAAGRTIEKTYRLRRWTDMRAKGYLSGDVHAHVPLPPGAALESKAEDLSVVNLMALDLEGHPMRAYFNGRPEALAGSRERLFDSRTDLAFRFLAGPDKEIDVDLGAPATVDSCPSMATTSIPRR